MIDFHLRNNRTILNCSLVGLLLFMEMLFCPQISEARTNIEFLDKEIIQKLNSSVFEVVVPKVESDKLEYARELPFHKLGFKDRNEKYHSIGTAFFINDKELMSAAHVFNLHHFSLRQDFYIRDLDGIVYRVGDIKSLSSIRDMVVFELEEYPDNFSTLKFSENVEIGDTAFSVGNAQGEGISFRAGQVASFTIEPEYGKWKNIRFTSPASPGNSGGPLIDISGDVLGIIVRKNSSENYNIAVPVSEVKNLKDKAEFHLRHITMMLSDAQNSVVEDWSVSIDLPGTVEEISSIAQNSLHEFYRTITTRLYKMYEGKYMPKGERFRAYLRNQTTVKKFGSLKSDADFNEWNLRGYSGNKIPVKENQYITIGKSYISDYQVLVEKPKNMPLKRFLASPQTVMDTMLTVFPLSRNIGREKIRLISLGEPETTEVIEDKLGRKWISSLWFLPYADFFVYSHCLAYPKGALCNVDVKNSSQLKAGYLATTYDNFTEVTVGYEGELKDWVEYLSLGKEYLPESFIKSRLSFNDDVLNIDFGNFKIDMQDSSINLKSSIHFHFGYSNKELLAEDLLLFELFPKKGINSHYRIKKYFSPGPFNSDTYKSKWEEISSSTGDFNGKVVNKNKQKSIHKVVESTEQTITSMEGKEIKKIYVIGCYFKITEENAADKCDHFSRSVSFNRTVH